MSITNLNNLLISISDFKAKLSEIIAKKTTRVIVKNGDPVAVVIPYSDYLNEKKNAEAEGYQKRLHPEGKEITLNNGVKIMVCVETGTSEFGSEDIAVKTFLKMKTSGDYKLHYTLHLSPPREEETLTIDEIVTQAKERIKK